MLSLEQAQRRDTKEYSCIYNYYMVGIKSEEIHTADTLGEMLLFLKKT
jgi:hypothetical protein